MIETYDTYVDEHGNQQNCFDINPHRVASDNSCNLEPGWYMLGGDLDLKSMTVSGDVNLVVRDDASIRVYNGIELTRGNSLTIWGEKENTGKLQVYGDDRSGSSGRQAIGVQDRLQPKLRGVQGKRQDPSSSDGEIRPEEEEQGGQLLRVHVPARAHTDGVFASGPHVWERHDDGRVSHAEADGGYLRVDVSRIFPDKLGDQVEIIGGDGNGDFWIKVSPLSYAYEVVDSGQYGDIGDNAMAAVLRYYQAVVGYLNA